MNMPPFIVDGAVTLAALYGVGMRSANCMPLIEEIENVAKLLDEAHRVVKAAGVKVAAAVMFEGLQRRYVAVYDCGTRNAVMAELEAILTRLTAVDA